MLLVRRLAMTLPMVAVLALTGCSGEEPTSDAHEGHGAGGHEMASDHAEAEVTPPPGADWNAADASYLTMMISHHRQAVEMSQLAETRATDPALKALADGIAAGQGGEILVMAAWLEQHDLPVPSLEEAQGMASMGGDDSMAGMEGMLSADQMTALADAEGADFDRLFLTGMVQHHEGALAMAQTEVGEGRDVVVIDMATEVIAGQTAEIARMRALLEG